MKTISAKRSLIESFKRAQLLPVLNPAPGRAAAKPGAGGLSPVMAQDILPRGFATDFTVCSDESRAQTVAYPLNHPHNDQVLVGSSPRVD